MNIDDILIQQENQYQEMINKPYNIIFLDIDGVLNCQKSAERNGGIIGVDDDKAIILARIVKENNAKIVLSSSWKIGWNREGNLRKHSEYLVKSLAKQSIYIADKLDDNINGSLRGKSIMNWLDNHIHKNFIILDDDMFDYEENNLVSHLIKTSFYKEGLTKDNISEARNKFDNAI